MNRSCTQANGKAKKAYRTFGEASVAARMGACNTGGDAIVPYECAQHGWHVGHKPTEGGSQ